MWDKFKDFISFLDDSDEKRDWYVKIISKDNGLITFQLQSGKTLSIPTHRILKIKEVNDEKK